MSITEPRLVEPAVTGAVPLAVDLDGTLVRTDLLIESVLLLVRRSPWRLLRLPAWLRRGKAFAKARLAWEAAPDVRHLPYDEALLAYLHEQKRGGRELVLASAADERLARAVADRLGLFDRVVASDGTTNLSAEHKREKLVALYGERGYDYVGNSRDDVAVWSSARRAVLVRASLRVRAKVAHRTDVERVFEPIRRRPRPFLRSLRPRQWLKNTLLFLPLLAAHGMEEPSLLGHAALGFVAFSLAASSAYLLNDLLDLPADRRHPAKKRRPLASGELDLAHAALAVPLLLGAAVATGFVLGGVFVGVLGTYYVLTLTYSLRLRNIVLLDVLALAALYTIRVIAGAAATGVEASTWLLAFCVFLFFSLAMVKRYAELVAMRRAAGPLSHARGYLQEDGELIAALGAASGYLSVLVLALYISTEKAQQLYAWRDLIWGICMLLLYWISHMWLSTHRGRMPDDPLAFAVTDPLSRALLVLMAIIFFLAT